MFAFVPPWWVVAAAIFIGAVALEPINPLYNTILQEHIPAGMRGRVFGVAIAIQFSTFPIGIMLYGFLLDGFGLQTTLVIFVIANLAVPLTMAVLPALRILDQESTSASAT